MILLTVIDTTSVMMSMWDTDVDLARAALPSTIGGVEVDLIDTTIAMLPTFTPEQDVTIRMNHRVRHRVTTAARCIVILQVIAPPLPSATPDRLILCHGRDSAL